MRKALFSLLFIAGTLGILLPANSYATTTWNGDGEANTRIDGISATVVVDCWSLCRSILDQFGRSEVLEQSANVGTDIVLSIEPGSNSFVQADPPSGINADLTLFLDAHIDYNGERYTSTESLTLASTAAVESFPPADPTTYEVQQEITYTNNTGSSTIVIEAGSHITLQQ